MRDSFNAAFAGLSKEDSRALFESFSKPVKGAGMLYPVSSALDAAYQRGLVADITAAREVFRTPGTDRI